MKYKIQTTDGCVAGGTTINGKDWSGEYIPTTMNEEERKDFFEYLMGKIEEEYNDGSIHIDSLISLFHYDDYHCSSPCDQCGDSVTTRTWEL